MDLTSARERLAPVDRFTVVYLGVTLIILMTLAPDPRAMLLGAAHAAWIGFLLFARRMGVHRHRPGELLLAFYPIPLFGLLYSEVGFLDAALHPGVFHDAAIQDLEVSVFGAQLSQELYLRWPFRLLGEFLHLGYFSYYLLVPVLLFSLWITGKRGRAFDLSVGTISLSFYTSFIVFIFYPVAGPYHMFEPPPVSEVGLILPDVTRWVLDRGSSVGAAFPSSHVAVATAVWFMALRYHVPVGAVYTILVPALALGAIYGGYHYAIDALVGGALGVLVGTLGHRLTARFSRFDTGAPV